MKNWYVESYYSCERQKNLYKVIDDDTSTSITNCLDEDTANLIAKAPKMVEALLYYKTNYFNNEPTLTVFQRMVNDALGIDSELEQKEKAELEERKSLKRYEESLKFINLLNKIREDFKGDENKTKREICVRIVKFIYSDTERKNFYVYDFYNLLIDVNHTYEQLNSCIDYVYNLEPKILQKAYWVNVSDIEIYDLEDEDVELFEKEGVVVHPETGELIYKGDPSILTYYKSLIYENN